jgi:NAD(P)-dependent dehydrogenase (short-subunit alcohol dehydrogenase family)
MKMEESIMKRFSLADRVSIVTGAAQGLGLAMAQALAEAGSRIVIAEVNMDKARDAAREISRRYGVEAEAMRCDVTRPEDAAALTDAALARFGRIDVLINNAGIVHHEPAEDVAYENWLKVINVDLNGVFIMSQAVGRAMLKAGRGSIINIASMSGLIVNTPQCQASYNAAKAGVIHLTRSLATEWATRGVRVNAIAPGYMKTAMTASFFEDAENPWVKTWMAMSPMKRPGTPDELGGLAIYLASDASSFTTGGVFVVDGGYSAW